MISLRSLWQRLPETMRVLGILAVVVDVVAAPSIVVMVIQHTAHAIMPWTAWGFLLHSDRGVHTWEVSALLLLAGAIYWGYTLDHSSGRAGVSAETAFGSARWRTARELSLSLQRWRFRAPKNPAGLVAGALTERGPVRQAWVLGQDGHNIVLGAPGAGKSLKVILPSLAVIAEAGENMVITDPKGELKQKMIGYLIQQNYQVATFDLRFPLQSLRWNPLAPIRIAMQEQRWAEATRMANDLANILATQGAPGGDNGAFFTQSARAIGAALALLVADQAPEAACHVASMYHVLTQCAGQLDAIMQALPSDHPARQAYGPLLTGSPETRQNQMSVVAIALSLFADRNIAWLTSTSDWHPKALLQPRTAVFIVVPDDSATYYPLASLFVTQILQTLSTAAAQESSGRLAVPIHMVLDEFGNLPKIPQFENALAVSRGRGIRITLTLQSLSQLEDHYGQKTAETMRNTCNTWVYLSANDTDTARVVSEKIGQSTIETTSRGQNWQSGAASRSENINTTGRALVTPDEVLRWKPTHTLVMQMGQMPAKLPARFWHDWPQSSKEATAPRPPAIDETTLTAPALWTPATDAPTQPAVLSINPQAPLHPPGSQGWKAIH